MTAPTTPTLEDLARTPNALAPHYSRFRVDDPERLLLSGHSHQAWPDVALDGQVEAFADAADAVDDKWDRAFAKADEVRNGYRRLLGDPDGDIALGESTHHLVVKFLSGLHLLGRSGPERSTRSTRPDRLVTTEGEFHSLRRQLTRLAEEGVDVVWAPTHPVDTLAERLAAAVGDDGRTGAVLVSAVLFETARIVPDLGDLADVCRRRGAELLVDAYHALGCVPLPIHHLGLSDAWVVGGGYKYLQLGEGNCFLRLPAQADRMRPVITGWFSEFPELSRERRPASGPGSRAGAEAGADGCRRPEPEPVLYGSGGWRFASATYDPTSNYRAARVLRFFAEQGLTPQLLRDSYRHQVQLLARAVDALDLPDTVLTRDRDTPVDRFGGFLAVQSPHAERLHEALKARGVMTDHRGRYLRLGPAPYLSDRQLEAGVAALGDAVAAL